MTSDCGDAPQARMQWTARRLGRAYRHSHLSGTSARASPAPATRGGKTKGQLMDLIEAIHTRRSIRSYLRLACRTRLIEEVIWDAAQAPPPFSGQLPWTFNVVQGVERISAYGDEALQYARDNHPDEPGWEWTDRPDFEVFWGALL